MLRTNVEIHLVSLLSKSSLLSEFGKSTASRIVGGAKFFPKMAMVWTVVLEDVVVAGYLRRHWVVCGGLFDDEFEFAPDRNYWWVADRRVWGGNCSLCSSDARYI